MIRPGWNVTSPTSACLMCQRPCSGQSAVKPEVASNSSQLTAQRTRLHVSEDIQLHGLVVTQRDGRSERGRLVADSSPDVDKPERFSDVRGWMARHMSRHIRKVLNHHRALKSPGNSWRRSGNTIDGAGEYPLQEASAGREWPPDEPRQPTPLPQRLRKVVVNVVDDADSSLELQLGCEDEKLRVVELNDVKRLSVDDPECSPDQSKPTDAALSFTKANDAPPSADHVSPGATTTPSNPASARVAAIRPCIRTSSARCTVVICATRSDILTDNGVSPVNPLPTFVEVDHFVRLAARTVARCGAAVPTSRACEWSRFRDSQG